MKLWMSRISNLFFLAFSLFILISSLRLGMGTVQDPGPGFVPFLASVLLLVLSSSIFIQERRRAHAKDDKSLSVKRENLGKPIGLMIALIGFALALERLGYLLSIFLLMVAFLNLYRAKRWYVQLATAAVIAGASFLVFYVWLRVPLPTGLFDIHSTVSKWIF